MQLRGALTRMESLPSCR